MTIGCLHAMRTMDEQHKIGHKERITHGIKSNSHSVKYADNNETNNYDSQYTAQCQ
jgi:hypothetical protein